MSSRTRPDIYRSRPRRADFHTVSYANDFGIPGLYVASFGVGIGAVLTAVAFRPFPEVQPA